MSQGKEKKETARAQGKDGSKVKVSVGAGAGKGVKRECKTGKNAVEMSSSPESSPASPRSISRTAPATGKQKGYEHLPEKYAMLVLWLYPPLRPCSQCI